MIRKVVSMLLLAVMAATLMSCAKAPENPDAPADVSINAENAQYWREVLQGYRDNADVRQIMLVRYTGGCVAISEENMRAVLMTAQSGMRVVIGEN